MESSKPLTNRSQILARKSVGKAGLLFCVALMLWVAGCTSSTTTSNAGSPQQSPQTYFAPSVAGTSFITNYPSPQTYSFDDDDTAGAFAQTMFPLGSQVVNSGGLSIGQRGLRSLGITAHYVSNGNVNVAYAAVTYNPPKAGSFAVELAGQAGGLVQLVGQPVAPLVAATQCPSFTSPQTYQFITIPSPLRSPGTAGGGTSWDPTTETAYGSVDIVSSGSAVTFQNIHQYTLPSIGGTVADPGSSSATGACGPTSFGNITNTPSPVDITAPGNGQVVSPQAKIGIGANGGLLVEDDQPTGIVSVTSGVTPPPPYNDLLGAGTGAIGLPRPSSSLGATPVAGATQPQYLGFIYSAGAQSAGNGSQAAWSSNLASFGFSSVPSSCASLAASTPTMIYGGDFPVNTTTGLPDPNNSSNPNYPYGNCDFAIDLGTETSNGLYPGATVWVGGGYAANSSKTTYSFRAVAIAGQINGKYAIFVLGVDSTQPWAIYLLQSN